MPQIFLGTTVINDHLLLHVRLSLAVYTKSRQGKKKNSVNNYQSREGPEVDFINVGHPNLAEKQLVERKA